MKYVIFYECRTAVGVLASEFEIESVEAPSVTDKVVIENALRDSVKFHQSGLGTINIKAIHPVGERDKKL